MKDTERCFCRKYKNLKNLDLRKHEMNSFRYQLIKVTNYTCDCDFTFTKVTLETFNEFQELIA